MSSSKVLEIDRRAAELPIDEQRELMTRIARRVETCDPAGGRPVSLRGLWAGKVPEDFDVDEALRSVRSEWKRKFDDIRCLVNPCS
jgi:hypothetical protein